VTLSAAKPVCIELAPPPAEAGLTLAENRARQNLAANLAAMAKQQEGMSHAVELPQDGEWVFARDGALTIRDQERWWTGCSVPRRAARCALRELDAGGALTCFPAPPHPAYVAEALALLRANQAVLVILPERELLQRFLACEDFSASVAANRLWFFAGEDWPRQVEDFLNSNPGLPIPMSFIRAPATGAARFDPMVDPAQQAFSRVTAERGAAIGELVASPRPNASGWCVVGGSHFRLWDDAGLVLAQTICGAVRGDAERVEVVDIDNPLRAGPLAVAQTAAGCDVLIAADLGRADLPGIVRQETAWITWMTKERCPSAAAAGPRDWVLLADATLAPVARAAGWEGNRIAVAAWPLPTLPQASGVHPGVTLIADIGAIEPPAELEEFSSHRVLWEAIANELSRDAFVAGDDARAYLARWAKRAGINAGDLPEAMFVEKLVYPVTQIFLARALAGARVPLRLAGAGWGEHAELARFAMGPIKTRAELLSIVASSAVLLDGWPGKAGHPVRRMGQPVLDASSCGGEGLERQARSLLRGAGKYQPDGLGAGPAAAVLSSALLSDILGR
jgi:hypothetical protein